VEAIVTVAALYVDPAGVYAGLDGVEVWDESRDARLYAGPWPVVAHPPCNKWSPLAYINASRFPDYHIGDDAGCFSAALHAVRTFGGVLEHPAGSRAWCAFTLSRPQRGYWRAPLEDTSGWVTEVDQGVYGHRARKRTWLYYIGPEPPALDWREAESDVIVSGFLHHAGTDESRRVRPKEASSTPPAFRDVLLAMARTAGVAACA
jgi:hypothetical protein